jgi:hypothetical protein
VNWVDLWGLVPLVNYQTLEGGGGGSRKGVDINLFNPNDGLYQNTTKVYRPTGTFIVGGHGDTQYIYDSSGNNLTPAKLANMIKNNPDYKPGDTIILDSCNTGKTPEDGGDPFAQKLADALGPGTIVKAPDNYLCIWSDGKIYIGPHIPFFESIFDINGPNVKQSTSNSGAMLTFKGR